MITNRASNMGSAGSPNPQTGTMQGIDGMTPIQIDGSGTVQPVEMVDASTETSLKDIAQLMQAMNDKMDILISILGP